MGRLKAVRALKATLKLYVLTMSLMTIGTIIGATLAYQVMKPTIIAVADTCITALNKAYSK